MSSGYSFTNEPDRPLETVNMGFHRGQASETLTGRTSRPMSAANNGLHEETMSSATSWFSGPGMSSALAGQTWKAHERCLQRLNGLAHERSACVTIRATLERHARDSSRRLSERSARVTTSSPARPLVGPMSAGFNAPHGHLVSADALTDTEHCTSAAFTGCHDSVPLAVFRLTLREQLSAGYTAASGPQALCGLPGKPVGGRAHSVHGSRRLLVTEKAPRQAASRGVPITSLGS